MNNFKYIYLIIILIASCLVQDSMAQGRKNKRNEPAVKETIIESTDEQLRIAFNTAVVQRDVLAAQIDVLSREMVDSKPGKAKKIGKELVAAQAEYDAVQRIIATFPASITNPSLKSGQINHDDAELRREMNRKLEEKMAVFNESDLTADIEDPELKRAYDEYQNKGITDPITKKLNEYDNVGSIYYSVRIGYARRGSASEYKGLSATITEHPMEEGGSVYYIGKYTTEQAARDECKRVRAISKYRDAYIIAFVGGKMTSISQARLSDKR